MTSFHETLRAAIQSSGLTLQELTELLAEHGTPISTGSLSGWTSGRSRPERAASLRALDTLERLLDVPAGSLRTTLPPRAPRGRQTSVAEPRVPAPIDVVLDRLEATRADIAGVRLNDLSHHEHLWVNGDGHATAAATSLLLQARHDEVSRFIVMRWYDASGLTPTTMRVRGADIGRAARHPSSPVFGYELRLPTPLAAGEVAMVEYTETFPPGIASTDLSLRTPRGTRDLTLRVEFTGQHAPEVVEGYRRRSYRVPSHHVEPITVHRGTAQLVLVNPEPGIHGLRWGDVSAEWEGIGIAPGPTGSAD